MKLGWGLGYNFRCDCCCKVFVINCSERELMRLSRWSVDIFTVKSVEEELTSWQQELQRDPSLGTLWVSRKKIFNYRWGSRLIKSKISVWSFPYEKPLSSIIEMLITKAKKPSQLFPYNLNQELTNPWFGTVRHDRKVPLNKKKQILFRLWSLFLQQLWPLHIVVKKYNDNDKSCYFLKLKTKT